MNSADQELISRLDAVNSQLDSFREQTGPRVRRLLSAAQLAVEDLRTIGHELISLGGACTTLGVALALRAAETGVVQDDGTQ